MQVCSMKIFLFFSFRTDSFPGEALAGLTKKCRALITPSRTLCFNFSCCRRWIGVPVGSSLTFVITPINQKLGSLKFVNVWTRQRRKEILKKNFRSVLYRDFPTLGLGSYSILPRLHLHECWFLDWYQVYPENLGIGIIYGSNFQNYSGWFLVLKNPNQNSGFRTSLALPPPFGFDFKTETSPEPRVSVFQLIRLKK